MIPICKGCNLSMGNTHMFSWVKNNKSEEVIGNFHKRIENYLGTEGYNSCMSVE